MILSWCARIHAAIKWTPVCRKKINLVTILVLFIPLSRLRHLLQTKSLIASCSDKAEGENHNLVSLSPCFDRSELIKLYYIDFVQPVYSQEIIPVVIILTKGDRFFHLQTELESKSKAFFRFESKRWLFISWRIL